MHGFSDALPKEVYGLKKRYEVAATSLAARFGQMELLGKAFGEGDE